jgi:hypothetical protein
MLKSQKRDIRPNKIQEFSSYFIKKHTVLYYETQLEQFYDIIVVYCELRDSSERKAQWLNLMFLMLRQVIHMITTLL